MTIAFFLLVDFLFFSLLRYSPIWAEKHWNRNCKQLFLVKTLFYQSKMTGLALKIIVFVVVVDMLDQTTQNVSILYQKSTNYVLLTKPEQGAEVRFSASPFPIYLHRISNFNQT